MTGRSVSPPLASTAYHAPVETVVLGLATLVCLAAPVAGWWYLEDFGEVVVLLAVLLLAGAWWQSGPHERSTALLREMAARYVLSCLYAVLGLLALPVVLIAGLGRLLSLLAVAPAAIFGAMFVEGALADAGVLESAEAMQSAAYWAIVVVLGGVGIVVMIYVGRALDRFESVGEALTGARDGLTGLLAAGFGVSLRR